MTMPRLVCRVGLVFLCLAASPDSDDGLAQSRPNDLSRSSGALGAGLPTSPKSAVDGPRGADWPRFLGPTGAGKSPETGDRGGKSKTLVDEGQLLGTMGPMTQKPNKVSETLRAAVNTADQTRYRICKDTGIDKATMSRFMNGGGLSLDGVDKLALALGLELTVKRPKKRKKG